MFEKLHWRSVALQSSPGARKWSRCRGFNGVQLRVSGCKNHKKFVLGAGAKAKSVTIQLTYIDRVSVSLFVIFSFLRNGNSCVHPVLQSILYY
jgi:hypothetical protein